VPAYFKQQLPIGLFKTYAYFRKPDVHPQKLLDISLILTSLRQFDNVFMFGEDVHVNECNIFLSLSTISYSYENDKWQRTCLIVKQAWAYIVLRHIPFFFYYSTASIIESTFYYMGLFTTTAKFLWFGPVFKVFKKSRKLQEFCPVFK
jgi:hypothetical protein